MSRVESFDPWVGREARILVLGSMPGVASLQQQCYYAHPRNAFWPILGRVFGIEWSSDCAARRHQFERLPLILWDVLQSCRRKGSLDASIEATGRVSNDIPALLSRHPQLKRVLFNGATAEQLFKRLVWPGIDSANGLELLRLPSTSPAHAGMGFEEKYRRWSEALRPAIISVNGASNISKS